MMEAGLKVLGPVDPRDVIYAKTRLRTPSTDQSLRRSPHGKKCTHTANCFIGRHPGTSSNFNRGTVFSRTILRRTAEGHLGSRCPLRPSIDASVCSGAIVFVCGDLMVNALILPLHYSDTPLPQFV
ncbi:uncharacterized protein TNCV_2416261 [Trichonephila clavipes]|nr:uncharacterized protein TNCV_2416261 [Trichonephila clavipes]